MQLRDWIIIYKSMEKKEFQKYYPGKDSFRGKSGLIMSLVGLIFFVRGCYWFIYFLEYVCFEPRFECFFTFCLSVIPLILYLAVSSGIFLRKSFGYYLAFCLLFIDVACSLLLFFLGSPVGFDYVILVFAFILFYLTWKNKDYFKGYDRVDKIVISGILLYVGLMLLIFLLIGDMSGSSAEYYERILGDAINEGDLRLCDNLAAGQRRDCCIREVAIATKNAGLCNNLGYCKLECFNGMAKLYGDLSFCEKMGDIDNSIHSPLLDDCIKKVAIATKDSVLCEKIQGDFSRSECYSMLGGLLCDPQLCGKSTNVYNTEDCYVSIGICKGDSAYCKKHRNYLVQQECIQKIQAINSTNV